MGQALQQIDQVKREKEHNEKILTEKLEAEVEARRTEIDQLRGQLKEAEK